MWKISDLIKRNSLLLGDICYYLTMEDTPVLPGVTELAARANKKFIRYMHKTSISDYSCAM